MPSLEFINLSDHELSDIAAYIRSLPPVDRDLGPVRFVANITPHGTGLKEWTEGDFFRALREGRRKDGTEIAAQMPWRLYGQMSDTELKAIWAYLQTVPAVEK